MILLEQNYRSTQTILSAANAVIARNPDRKPKNLWTDAGAGEKIVGWVAGDEHEEATFVANEVDRLPDAGLAKPRDVAIFYRTNAASRVFEEVFIRVGMPYRVVGGVRFYERKEIRDALAYLRVLANPEDVVCLRRILNVPKRGIGDRAEACMDALASRERISFPAALRSCEEAYGIAARSLNPVRAFNDLMEALRDPGGGGHRAVHGAARRSSSRPGTCASWRSPPTRRTRAGSRTSASSSRWPASTRRAPGRVGRRVPGAGGAGRRLRPAA